jgi:8-oxo-dGTP pyrophosphatase MutT (NUDIX family)
MERSAILAAIRARLVRALTPPADRPVRFAVDGQTAGWLSRSRLDRLAAFARIFVIDAEGLSFAPAFATTAARTDAMAEVADALAAAGELTAWRDERYAVRAAFDAPPWFFLERACARWFGVRTWAVHVNGAADVDGAPTLWFARRSTQKSIDPGRFDTLVGGGIAELEAADAAMRREAWEEAGIAQASALAARRAGHVDVRHVAADGIQRETIFVYDLDLPAAFVPDNQDGEAIAHRRLTLDAASSLIAAVQGSDVTTLDAAIVTLDYLTRRHDWPIADDVRAELAALCRLPLD